ncbi:MULTISPECIES: putative peptide maturation dehydrogenase [unclassified Streptomyces]|uniref:putative peptide maturation dehydrogenase n=1 Tax=unclassified Streptomyces TaxID=2593676 RepID=UPI001660D167|nr:MULTISPECIES: putative peptide maturation dehydrogenase [unclassified Streptomyces]MBD0707259.1 putative peptide maturation dehydrogenase [Streptomyces sp. CBMA291]MBD0713747.1 putative peptide maturation dehydrogenase [Streptomyces sp. CBMA370]
MRIRRCAVLFLEPREEVAFDLESLLTGGAGLRRTRRWLALAAHLDAEVEVTLEQRELLGRLSPGEWSETDTLNAGDAALVPELIDSGLVIAEEEGHADDPVRGDEGRTGHPVRDDGRPRTDGPVRDGGESRTRHRERDDVLRAGHWWPPAAMMHRLARWEGLDSVVSMEANELTTAADLRRKLGPPPPHVREYGDADDRVPLPHVEGNAFDAMLARRATCRNFDGERALPLALCAHMLQRVFAARARVRVDDDTVFLKKNTPSGGGLHPTEAYLIVRNVEGLAPGLYHYHPVDHALTPLPAPAEPLDRFALRALAGQHWFSDAPVLAVLVPRYARSFWKYRRHAKAYRALVLDSGHLSQTLYLSATELGLGAFVTSAINEVDIERGFGLDPLTEGPLAVCGFGWRAREMTTSEFDPAEEIWLHGAETEMEVEAEAEGGERTAPPAGDVPADASDDVPDDVPDDTPGNALG